MSNFRLRYTKEGRLRLISHLDLVRGFERAMRRGELPIAFSEGFHPHPVMNFGPALSVGIESRAEYIDIMFSHPIEAELVLERLNRALPEGLRIMEVKPILHKVKPLTAVINRATYRITPSATLSENIGLKDSVERLWASERLEVQRRSKDGGEKQVDIRPLWHGWEIQDVQGRAALEVEVEVGSHGAIRPEEFIRLVGQGLSGGRVLRKELWIYDGVNHRTPMDLLGVSS